MPQDPPEETLETRIAAVNDIICSIAVLTWDARTSMPPGGAKARGHQIATLTRIARDMLCADETLDALVAAEARTGDATGTRTRGTLAAVRQAIDLHRRVPAELVARRAALRPPAQAAWAQARATSDFSIFEPFLHETVEAARDYAAAVGRPGQHPYDAMVELYEPGETLQSLTATFGALRAGLEPILAAVTARGRPAPRQVCGHFPEVTQRALAMRFAERFGYDFDRGRLDSAQHPFEIAFTRDDVRITTRYREDDPTQGLFGTFHETGHGLYEQNVDPAFTRTALATDLIALYPMGGAGSGVHESQSRLYENHVGRSATFWQLHFDELGQTFPGQFMGIDADLFYRSVTAVAPSDIRTEADEITYDFHIFLRIELEAALMSGDLVAGDVPQAWNEAMRRHLGIAVADDARGCLQDVHWAAGVIGSFCSYTIGNVMAAQVMAAMHEREPGIQASLARGDYAPLAVWLKENIWRRGRLHSKDELLRDATGRSFDIAPYLDYLKAKYLDAA